tara:strand:- start:832 stop:1068 length:237 start_codon:yes stop_codon:yes gene_type:complete
LKDVAPHFNPDAAFYQEAAALIDQPRPVRHQTQTLPRTVQGLKVKLFFRLIATNDIVGRVLASAIASASRSSVLLTFT